MRMLPLATVYINTPVSHMISILELYRNVYIFALNECLIKKQGAYCKKDLHCIFIMPNDG